MELGLLSHVVSKDDGVVKEWLIRRKIDHTFVDVIVGKGRVPVDYKRESLLNAMDELVKKGHQITEIKNEMDMERRDVLVTLKWLPETITKGMRSTHIQKETYEFEHGKPVGSSGFRKRMMNKAATSYEIAGGSQNELSESEDETFKPPKMVKFKEWRDDGEKAKLSTASKSEDKEVAAISMMKLSKRVRKIKRKKAFKKKLMAEQLAREVGVVANLVGELKLEDGCHTGNHCQSGDSKTFVPIQVLDGQSVSAPATEKPSQADATPVCEETKTTWDGKHPNSPFTSDDDREFQTALDTWIGHTKSSGGLSGLGFTMPLAAANQELHGENPPAVHDAGNKTQAESDLETDLIKGMEELDLGEEVRKWFEISSEDEKKLLDGEDSDDLLDWSVDEINKGLSDIIDTYDERALRSPHYID